jgi:hypothetical protein
MFRFTIRDVLWLTMVVALGVGWWAELRARHRAENLYQGARRSVEETAKLLRVSTIEKDGQIIALRGAGYVSCPECGQVMYIESTPTQCIMNDADGKRSTCWQLTAKCVDCKGKFGYILMPDNVPGYMTWTRLSENNP